MQDAHYQEKFGKRIRSLREKKGLSQEAFADEADIARSFAGAIERGKKDIRLSTLRKVAKGLKTTPSEMLKGL